jgi:NADPH:quinone reductase
MRAARINEPGGPEVLEIAEVDDPEPGDGEVLVRVHAAGLNFIDTYQRSGAYPLELPATLGLEGAGEVLAVGSGVAHRKVGDRVAWLDVQGSYADVAVMRAARTVTVPHDLDLELAAAVILQGVTAHFLSHSTFRIDDDHTILLYAAAGGVGRLLVQLAKRRGARVIACTSTAEKAEEAQRLGADHIIRYRDEDVPDAVARLTDGSGVDVVFDSVGRDTFADSIRCLKTRGTLAVFGQASGAVPPFDLQLLNRSGSLYLTRPNILHYTATPDELEWRAHAVLELVRQGGLDVRIHQKYPLREAATAHRDLESGATMGKLLLVP